MAVLKWKIVDQTRKAHVTWSTKMAPVASKFYWKNILAEVLYKESLNLIPNPNPNPNLSPNPIGCLALILA